MEKINKLQSKFTNAMIYFKKPTLQMKLIMWEITKIKWELRRTMS